MQRHRSNGYHQQVSLDHEDPTNMSCGDDPPSPTTTSIKLRNPFEEEIRSLTIAAI